MPRESFIQSLSRGLDLGVKIGEFVDKKRDEKKAKQIFSQLSKKPELANNPSELWSTYASKLVAEGIIKDPAKAMELMAKGTQLHLAKIQLDRAQAFDKVQKRAQQVMQRALNAMKNGNMDLAIRLAKPLIDAYNAIPDGIEVRPERQADGSYVLRAYDERTGKPTGRVLPFDENILRIGTLQFVRQAASLSDPTMLQNTLNALEQGKRAQQQLQTQRDVANIQAAATNRRTDVLSQNARISALASVANNVNSANALIARSLFNQGLDTPGLINATVAAKALGLGGVSPAQAALISGLSQQAGIPIDNSQVSNGLNLDAAKTSLEKIMQQREAANQNGTISNVIDALVKRILPTNLQADQTNTTGESVVKTQHGLFRFGNAF